MQPQSCHSQSVGWGLKRCHLFKPLFSEFWVSFMLFIFLSPCWYSRLQHIMKGLWCLRFTVLSTGLHTKVKQSSRFRGGGFPFKRSCYFSPVFIKLWVLGAKSSGPTCPTHHVFYNSAFEFNLLVETCPEKHQLRSRFPSSYFLVKGFLEIFFTVKTFRE